MRSSIFFKKNTFFLLNMPKVLTRLSQTSSQSKLGSTKQKVAPKKLIQTFTASDDDVTSKPFSFFSLCG